MRTAEEEDRYANELIMTGALFTALHFGHHAAGMNVQVVYDQDNNPTPELYVRVDFLRSRYRITVTLDPEPQER